MTHHAYRYGVWENPTLLTMAAILLESQRCLGEGLLDHEAPDATAMEAIEGSFLQFAKHVASEEIEHEALGEMVLYGLLNTLNKHLSINMDHLFGPSAGPAKSPSLN
jgi:hypothetical protein